LAAFYNNKQQPEKEIFIFSSSTFNPVTGLFLFLFKKIKNAWGVDNATLE
jgi:hypothetical protein